MQYHQTDKGSHFVLMKYRKDHDTPQNIALAIVDSQVPVMIIRATNKADDGA